ncbi:MAG TPA: OsmC family protein [Kofleriaceae bacterium]|nr:OsmC family protein [Kofleriaceae bacterium]
MELQSKVTWTDGMAFDTELEGFHFTIDADAEFGGRGLGPRPKGLLLSALLGCTAMDVISILGKMRITVDGFEVSATGTLDDEMPKAYRSIVLRYDFRGTDLPENKLRRAVQLSEERYCGVRATLVPAVDIGNEIWVNGELLGDSTGRLAG